MFKELGIKTPYSLLNYLKKYFNYGFVYRNKVFTETEKDFHKKMDIFYKIRLGNDFLKNKYGVCWDFCEFERLFFLEYNIEHNCYFINSKYGENNGPTHTFIIYKYESKWYWFEYSWFECLGIWEFDTKENALKTVLKKYKDSMKVTNIELYKIKQIKKRLNTFEYINYCLKSEKVKNLND